MRHIRVRKGRIHREMRGIDVDLLEKTCGENEEEKEEEKEGGIEQYKGGYDDGVKPPPPILLPSRSRYMPEDFIDGIDDDGFERILPPRDERDNPASDYNEDSDKDY